MAYKRLQMFSHNRNLLPLYWVFASSVGILEVFVSSENSDQIQKVSAITLTASIFLVIRLFLLVSSYGLVGIASATFILRTPSSMGRLITSNDKSICSCGFDSFSASMAYNSSWNFNWFANCNKQIAWERIRFDFRYLLDSCIACKMLAMWSSKQFQRLTKDWSLGKDRLCRRTKRANRPNQTELRVCIGWSATSDTRCSQKCPTVSTDRLFYGIEK